MNKIAFTLEGKFCQLTRLIADRAELAKLKKGVRDSKARNKNYEKAINIIHAFKGLGLRFSLIEAKDNSVTFKIQSL